MSRKRRIVRVRYDRRLGMYVWCCRIENCPCAVKSGASLYWEIAQRFADEHIRECHYRRQATIPTPREGDTPPGGMAFDWSDTGMHIRIREDTP